MSYLKNFILLFIIVVISLLCFVLIKENSLYDDEPGNYAQIKLFIEGKPAIYGGYTKLPGYALFIAGTARLLGNDSFPTLRFISFTIYLAAFLVFYKLAKQIDPGHAVLKTFQLSFFPVLFPYIFHLYTEGLSFFLIFCALFFALKNRVKTSELLIGVSVLVRQTNIFWVIFIIVLECLKNNVKLKEIVSIKFILSHSIAAATLILFALFTVLNHGAALGSVSAHPSFGVFSGNIFYALFIFFFLFLPLNISLIPKIIRVLQNDKRIVQVMIAFIIVGTLTFSNSHPWNQYPEHLRNRVLLFFTLNSINKITFFSIISLSVLSLRVTKLLHKQYYTFYVLAFLSLAPIWLIETRYALVPFVFFILFRKTSSNLVESATLFLYLLFSGIFYYGYLRQLFYL